MKDNKRCPRCAIIKSVSEYTLAKSGKPVSYCRKCMRLRYREYTIKYPEKIKEKGRQYWAKAKYSEKALEVRRRASRKWHKNNPEYAADYRNNSYKTNINVNLACKIRKRIEMALKLIGAGRKDRIINLLGCDYAFFKKYFESKFQEGMSWDLVLNGKIHLDHIIPCSKFNLTDDEQHRVCFHYTNMQPLWALDNLKKSNKIL